MASTIATEGPPQWFSRVRLGITVRFKLVLALSDMKAVFGAYSYVVYCCADPASAVEAVAYVSWGQWVWADDRRGEELR